MNRGVQVLEGKKPTGQQERLAAFFDEVEKKQVEFLNEAGKRIIELSTALLGLLFTVSAFGDKFPPASVANSPAAKWLIVATLVLFLLALAAGILTVQPRRYQKWDADLTEMRSELDKAMDYKIACFRLGSALFGLGCLGLVGLVIAMIG